MMMKIMKINDATIYEQSVTPNNDDEDDEYKCINKKMIREG